MAQTTVLISSGSLEQKNVSVFVSELQKINGFVGHLNLFAKDCMNFYRRYGKLPESLEILKAFVIEKVGRDPEAYLFSNEDYSPRASGILLKQVTPLVLTYEFVNGSKIGLCSFVKRPKEKVNENLDVKIFCPAGLVVTYPDHKAMTNYLESVKSLF